MTTPITPITATSSTSRRRAAAAAGALAVVAAVGIGTVLTGNDPEPTSTAPGRTLALTAPGSDLAASCVVPDAAGLAARNPVAFEGTATTVGANRVALDVRRWFNNRPDGVTRVELANPGGSDAVALDGIAFTTGRSYLVSAVDGTVSICGLSGESSPELLALFQQAFPNGG